MAFFCFTAPNCLTLVNLSPEKSQLRQVNYIRLMFPLARQCLKNGTLNYRRAANLSIDVCALLPFLGYYTFNYWYFACAEDCNRPFKSQSPHLIALSTVKLIKSAPFSVWALLCCAKIQVQLSALLRGKRRRDGTLERRLNANPAGLPACERVLWSYEK